jgi:hypothetical protein
VSYPIPLKSLMYPTQSPQDELLDWIIVERTDMIVRKVLHEGPLPAGMEPIGEMLRRNMNRFDFAAYWDPAFGVLNAPPECRATETYVALGLRLFELGCPGAWSTEVIPKAGFRFDRWALPHATHIAVEASGGEVRLTLTGADGATTLVFVTDGAAWSCDTPGTTALPESHLGASRIIVLGQKELWNETVADIAYNLDPAAPRNNADNITYTLKAIRDVSDDYLSWVAKVVRFVAPWRVTSDRRPTGSSSCSNAPGLVGIGNHDHAASLAESLIHEASHHYFYAVLRLGRVDDQSDTRLHLNPFFGRNRPLDRILFAYHAFLNVHRFCLMALEAPGADLSYFEPREKEVKDGLKIMEAAIDGNPALTTLGNAIWADLRTQMPVFA